MTRAAPVLEAALAYREVGLAPTICYGSTAGDGQSPKSPCHGGWEKGGLTEADIRRLWKPGRYVGLLCGDGLEVLDFDCRACFYPKWAELVEKLKPNLLSNLYLETSPSGGIHAAYKCSAVKIPGNAKLAMIRRISADGKPNPRVKDGWLVRDTQDGKEYQAVKLPDGTFEYWPCPIETRGTGGQFVVAPSEGYVAKQNSLLTLPELTAEEREDLITAARALDERKAEPKRERHAGGLSVADDFAIRGDLAALIERHGWKRWGDQDWTRPGKQAGVSGRLHKEDDGRQWFHVWSSNAAPLDVGAHSAFAVYAVLEHGGDTSAAAKALYAEGYGERREGDTGSRPAPEEPGAPVTWDLADLHAYQPEADQSVLLGRRWLCQGQGAMWIGPSGIGKSVLAVQAALTWALGRPFFGIVPARPLKSLIVLGEDDKGDTSEMVRGSVEGLDAAGELEALRQRVIIVQECVATGGDFCRLLYLLVSAHSPALVWINPLLAFLGGDVNSQEVCSKFLRNGLNPIAMRHACAIHVIHHTTKPSTDPKTRAHWSRSDYSYIGAGSAELTNWPRAVCFLREVGDGEFRLMLCKRGERAGIVDAEGRPVRDVNLRHGRGRLFWEAGPSDAEKVKSETEPLVRAALQEIEVNRTYNREQVCQVVQGVTGRSRSVVRQAGTPANAVFLAVIQELTSPEFPGILRKREGVSGCPGVSDSVRPDG